MKTQLHSNQDAKIENIWVSVAPTYDLSSVKVRKNWNYFFKPTFPPKNEQRNSILLLWDLFLFVFWRKLKTPKRHFEINWPLVHTYCECDRMLLCPLPARHIGVWSYILMLRKQLLTVLHTAVGIILISNDLFWWQWKPE